MRCELMLASLSGTKWEDIREGLWGSEVLSWERKTPNTSQMIPIISLGYCWTCIEHNNTEERNRQHQSCVELKFDRRCHNDTTAGAGHCAVSCRCSTVFVFFLNSYGADRLVCSSATLLFGDTFFRCLVLLPRRGNGAA